MTVLPHERPFRRALFAYSPVGRDGKPLLLNPPRGNADTHYVSGIPSVQRASLERVLGKAVPYAIAPIAGLKAALRWACGCRAIEHDDGDYTLIACGKHQTVSLKSASMISFR